MKWFFNLISSIFSKEVKAEPRIEVPAPQATTPEIPRAETSSSHVGVGAVTHALDLSHHNESVDFLQLRNQGLVILKATEGASGVDKRFNSRFSGLKVCGIRRGAYHFYRTNRDPIVQAEHFLATVGELQAGDVLALDYETCDIKGLVQTIADLKVHKGNALKFLLHIEKVTGIKCKFYTYHNVIQEVGFGAEFAEYDLWYARYTSNTPAPAQGPWNKIWMWQYSDKGTVPGVTGDVDMNWMSV